MTFLRKHLTFMAVSFMTSLLGSSFVHHYYQPLADFDEMVEEEFNELLEAYVQEKEKK